MPCVFNHDPFLSLRLITDIITALLYVHYLHLACWIAMFGYSLFWYKIACSINTLRPRQNGRLFADNTFKRIFLNENIRISIKISLKFVPKGFINNIPALVLIMAWHRPGDKPLSEPIMVTSLTHICVTRPQWVNSFFYHNQCICIKM